MFFGMKISDLDCMDALTPTRSILFSNMVSLLLNSTLFFAILTGLPGLAFKVFVELFKNFNNTFSSNLDEVAHFKSKKN